MVNNPNNNNSGTKDMQQQGNAGTLQGDQHYKILLMAPKDRENKLQKRTVIYKFKCPYINCPEQYIAENGRTFGDRLKEHLRAPSQSTTIVVPHDTQSALNVLPLSTGNNRESQETSRRLCTFM